MSFIARFIVSYLITCYLDFIIARYIIIKRFIVEHSYTRLGVMRRLGILKVEIR